MNNQKNEGVDCAVRACRFHDCGQCKLKKITVTSDMNDHHYCGNFEERPDVPEL